ncbi:peptide methionine sulfoxide reductase-like [Telopea speciosissima]|uniref:peptide methionine sulfoxide reductase-like n=1 Tax=Telopea speciosissima TaxID=54955 RepID=UPI001CC57977|nr:peptide methionine sulfoxide reductase-like [Telopea speciosissima]XP_043687293.1 peptide methionine sulfoxide reductase-like [Telopea speciosissima]
MSSSAMEKGNPKASAQDPDTDQTDRPGLEFAQFGAGCFWGVELAFQRVEGVVKTEVGYSQGHLPDPTYQLVCTGTTNHAEIVRVQFDPAVCPYANLLSVFWSRHDPTTLNRQGGDVGSQYRSGIYYYNEAQARWAQESKEAKQREMTGKKIVTEILPAKRFYRAEEYHQQYLEKGGRNGSKQSAGKGCNDPIRCYG